ncbi:MAG: glycosyltransferase family 4 protein [Bacteroidetes bacterium]|nr:glycosyltransferase family 4 protein [Bacteroidota bacterium]
MKERKIVIVNQAINYLTIGIANEFAKEYDEVALITGSVHVQGEELDDSIKISKVNKYTEKSLKHKFFNWMNALVRMYFLLLFKFRGYEILYITNPPMAYLLSFFLPQRFSVLMWDVYPDSLKIFGMSENHLFYRIWTKANRLLLKRAKRVFTIGQKISGLINNYVPKDKITIVPLWTTFTNEEIISKEANFFITENNLNDKFVVQYSGNIGVTHNVEVLLDIAELLIENEEIIFQIIGRGTRVEDIKRRISQKSLKNCQWLPFQSDEDFPYSLAAADLGVVILDDRTSQGSVPSKTYNLMKAGKPILYIASEDSELRDYAQKFQNGICLHASEVNEISSFIKDISGRKDLYQKLSINSTNASAFFVRENASLFVKSMC